MEVTIFLYVDDCIARGPGATIQPAYTGVKELKRSEPNTEINILGATIALHGLYVEATLRRRKRNGLIRDCREIAIQCTLSPSAAGNYGAARAGAIVDVWEMRPLPYGALGDKTVFETQRPTPTPQRTFGCFALAGRIISVSSAATRNIPGRATCT